jgi:hypothetical protein
MFYYFCKLNHPKERIRIAETVFSTPFVMSAETTIKDRLEFITVAAEFVLFLEHTSENEKERFIDQSLKYLTALYLKTLLLSGDFAGDEEETERVVSETDYEWIRSAISGLLAADDDYLTAFHPDMRYSDTPVAATISEDLADIYQELKDFLYNCQLGSDEIMQAALANCLLAFRAHWGRKVLNALAALHQLMCEEPEAGNGGNREEDNNVPSGRESFLRHQFRNDEES